MGPDRSPDRPPTASDGFQRLAAAHLSARGTVHPTLVGYRDGRAVCAVELRTHPAGGQERPIVEALALLLPLGCDALAYLASGRAWSTEDPIPPVTEDVDLRQRVAVVVVVTAGNGAAPDATVQLLPFRLDPVTRRVVWQQPVAFSEPGTGPLVELLAVPLAGRDRLDGDPAATGRQALRLVRLGHRLIPLAGAEEQLWRCIHAAIDGADGEPLACR